VKGTDGEVANALVCKTSIRGFNSRSVLQILDYFFWISAGLGRAAGGESVARRALCVS
jgi:hypothetical protein